MPLWKRVDSVPAEIEVTLSASDLLILALHFSFLLSALNSFMTKICFPTWAHHASDRSQISLSFLGLEQEILS
jgi:hypothetical protein